ncbi:MULTISPECIES: hypothetical protein [Kribbella]|uniref:Uncharacterized protein n=1 Tax=Kribbella karoonensis TaxID=324851 RepID=A0ABN2D5Z5_9ACTN
MPEPTQRVPEDSPAYREFARLYDLARQLRPTEVDRWKGDLYATDGPGGFDRRTGAIGIDEPLLLHELTGRASSTPRRQAQALATVLHRATEAGMHQDAAGAVNAVRNGRSLALHDGFASVRAASDLGTFAEMAGYPEPRFDPARTGGTYAAANNLINQVSGARVDRVALLRQLSHGPVAMHFDQLADAVVQNRLHDTVRDEPGAQQRVRRELIATMLHPAWDSLAQRSPEAGARVAEEIGSALNAKVDEIRRRSPQTPQVAASDGPQPEPTKPRPQQESTARFLTGLAPAGRATGQTPSLGDGSRAAAQHATPAARPRTPGEPTRRSER